MVPLLDFGGAARAQRAEDNKVGNCGRVWHVGFFFDGVGRNVEQDALEHRLSNVARLFRAYPDEDSNSDFVCNNKFYFSGMGTPYKEEPTTKIYTLMDSSLNSLKGDINGIPENTVKDVAEDILKGKGEWFETFKNHLRKLIDPEELRKKRAGIFKNMAKKSFIESTPWVRDNEVISAYFLTGESTRINAAKLQFANAFAENSTSKKGSAAIKIKSICVSVYGYDMGAVLARKFLDEFLDEVCEKKDENHYLFKQVPVEIVFAGFFDCSRHSPASNSNGLDYFFDLAGGRLSKVSMAFGEKAIALDTALPGVVNSALHLAAAYERRLWRVLYRLGSHNQKHCERLLPGCSEDVGGGLKADEQKPSAELCRVALHMMYKAASAAGVPFPDFQKLKVLSETISNYFLLHDVVEGRSVMTWMAHYKAEVKRYLQANWINDYQHIYNIDDLSDDALEFYLDVYFLWLGKQYYLYCGELNRLDHQRIAIIRNPLNRTGALGSMNQDGASQLQEIEDKTAELESLWGWLDDVKRVARGLSNDFKYGRPGDSRMKINEAIYRPAWRRAELFLLFSRKAWSGEAVPDDGFPGVNILHAYFSHDVQTIEPGGVISESFFLRRMTENPTG